MIDLQQPILELSVRLTTPEANMLRTAMSRAAGEKASEKASRLLFRSLRERQRRFTLKELP
jgi:hypothetical protein